MAALTLSSIRLCTLALGVALALASPALADDVSVQLDAGTGFAIKNSTGTVERLRVDEATGNISRNGALFVHTTGTENLFVGPGAGNNATTGYSRGNSAFGFDALRNNTTGFFNSAFGFDALRNNTTGHRNVAVGDSALGSNTAGSDNSAVGINALFHNTTGYRNSAFGAYALISNTMGAANSAVGSSALRSNTTGTRNSAVGYGALRNNTTGADNTAAGYRALRFNTTGRYNSAFGVRALTSNTTGRWTSAFGKDALQSNTTGRYNSAFGYSSLRYNTTGEYNSAFGGSALLFNTTGHWNSAFGVRALRYNSSGVNNSAFGHWALRYNTTGNRNVALGDRAGFYQTTGSDNIYLANLGVDGESGQIKVGTTGTHTQATIAGIHNSTSTDGVAVLVNASGTLGTTTSSARFKRDVHDMGESSDVLMKLRPVTFRYREDAVGAEETKTTQYGLIAEEVAEVAPELVAPDAEGKPYSVKYHELPALLLNELQEQQRTIENQQQEIVALTTRLARLEAHAR